MATKRTSKKPRRTAAQNSRMWAAVSQLRKLGLSKADAEGILRDTVESVAGHRHSSRLDVYQAAGVIRQLEDTIERSQSPADPDPKVSSDTSLREPWGRRGPGPRMGRVISPRQQETLQALYAQAGMDTPERQRGFCERQTGKPWPQTQKHCDAIFEALKAIILRDHKPAEMRARFEALRDHPALDDWKTGFVADVCEQYQRARKPEKVLTTHRLKKLMECEAAVAEAT